MHVFALVNVKRLLITPVADAVPHFLPDNHVVARHVVVHHVLQIWLISHQVNHVEVDVLGGRNLEPVRVLHVVNRSSHLDCFVAFPMEPMSQLIFH